MKWLLLIGASLALTSCSLLSSLISTLTPKPANVAISIKAPSGKSINVTFSGKDFKQTYSDDSRGFSTKVEIAAGNLNITPDILDGYKARINTTGKTGNKVWGENADITLVAEENLAITVQYDANPSP